MTDTLNHTEPPIHDHNDHDDDNDDTSLRPYIYFPGVVCLNEAVPGSGASILKVPKEQLTAQPSLQSPEDDPELLLHVPFMETVTIRSIRIIGRNSDASRVVKVFVDRDDIDFEVARELQPQALVELPASSSSKEPTIVDEPLLPGRFRDATSVTLFFSSTATSSTEISHVGLEGVSTHQKRLPVTYAVHEVQAPLEDHEVHAEGIGAAEGFGFH